MNYIFWTKVYFMSENYVKSIILKIIMPYNFIKQILNLILAFVFARKFEVNKNIFKF